jgi:hypothetical protein
MEPLSIPLPLVVAMVVVVVVVVVAAATSAVVMVAVAAAMTVVAAMARWAVVGGCPSCTKARWWLSHSPTTWTWRT